MSAMALWLIRHKPSGGYLPEPAGRMGRGGSHVEPQVYTGDPLEDRPRLFVSKLSASRALSSWLRGKVHHISGYDGFAGEYYEDSSLEVVPTRVREDMEIIAVDLVIP